MPAKIWVPLLVILSGVSWLAYSNLSKANYFYNVSELEQLGNRVEGIGLRVKGRIVAGSIKDKQKPVVFDIEEEGAVLTVHYIGEEPLPDLFQDRADAVVEGTIRADGIFEAKHLQAKCASKYEAEAPGAQPSESEYPDYEKKPATERSPAEPEPAAVQTTASK